MRWFIDAIVKPYHPTLLGLPLIALILYFGLRWATPAVEAKSAMTPLECLKIQQGMTENEVEKILKQGGLQHQAPDDQGAVTWKGDNFELVVYFDAKRTVTHSRLVNVCHACFCPFERGESPVHRCGPGK